MDTIKVTQLAESLLFKLNQELGHLMKGHFVFIKCFLFPPLDDEFRVVIE